MMLICQPKWKMLHLALFYDPIDLWLVFYLTKHVGTCSLIENYQWRKAKGVSTCWSFETLSKVKIIRPIDCTMVKHSCCWFTTLQTFLIVAVTIKKQYLYTLVIYFKSKLLIKNCLILCMIYNIIILFVMQLNLSKMKAS
jgi:hypothetical protein